MSGITFLTHKIKRYTGVDGYLVQFIVPIECAPQIDDYMAKHVNGELSVTIEKPKKRRTITANNYLWVLCDEIAKQVGTDKESIYKAIIRRVGVFDYVLVKAQAADRFRENWNEKGLGWFTEEVFYPDRDKRQFTVYYGTSTYDQEQMARVIDEAVDEARNIGVKTLTKQELKELKEKWKP